eukprot:6415406-Amphidinium_carterae.1
MCSSLTKAYATSKALFLQGYGPRSKQLLQYLRHDCILNRQSAADAHPDASETTPRTCQQHSSRCITVLVR